VGSFGIFHVLRVPRRGTLGALSRKRWNCRGLWFPAFADGRSSLCLLRCASGVRRVTDDVEGAFGTHRCAHTSDSTARGVIGVSQELADRSTMRFPPIGVTTMGRPRCGSREWIPAASGCEMEISHQPISRRRKHVRLKGGHATRRRVRNRFLTGAALLGFGAALFTLGAARSGFRAAF